MSTALKLLTDLVENAEIRAKNARLEEALQQAEQIWQQAQAAYDNSTQALNQVQLDYGDPDDQLKNIHEELEILEKRASEVESFIDADQNIEQLFQQARDEAQAQYQANKKQFKDALALVKANRQAVDEAYNAYEMLQKQLRDSTHEQGIAPLSPGRAVDDLIENIDAGLPEINRWNEEARHALFCVWLGKARKLQDTGGLDEDELDTLHHQVFGRLNAASKTLTSHFIDALNREFVTNWDAYIREHQERYNEECAIQQDQANREKENEQLQIEDQERRRKVRLKAESYMGRLTELCGEEASAENHKAIIELTEILLSDVGIAASDRELVDVLYPLRLIFSNKGSVFRPLRRAFQAYEAELVSGNLKAQYASLVSDTKGKRAVIIGGSPREQNRLALLDFFEWSELRWEACEGNEPRMLQQIEQSLRAGGIDMVLELTSLVGHHVEKLKPVCEEMDIPFVRVARGYGVSALVEAIKMHTIEQVPSVLS